MELKMKTLDNQNQAETKKSVSDVKITGSTDLFQLLCKASSVAEGWMKSTKAMEIPGRGCVVQITTQQGDHVAESSCFVEGVKIVDDVNDGRKLVKDPDFFVSLTEISEITKND